MTTRVRPIKLSRGDVRELRIFRNKRATRLVVYDEDRGMPLIQARLGPAEQLALRNALRTRKWFASLVGRNLDGSCSLLLSEDLARCGSTGWLREH